MDGIAVKIANKTPALQGAHKLLLVDVLHPPLTDDGVTLYNVTHEHTRSPYSFISEGGNASPEALAKSAGGRLRS